MKKRYPGHSKRYVHRKLKYPDFKPGADARLKKVFAEIGVPEKSDFTADPFQIEAIEAIRRSDCLVSAPTGSGKTWIALQAIRRIYDAGGMSWYASPLKALSNSKYSEFSKAFGKSNVGILTGDRKENPNAPIIVGTTEILRNQLYDAMHRGENLSADLVVLDEAHFLGDEDRGVVWEEIIIYLPSRIPLLLLSATIGNAEQIADWISSIRSSHCCVVQETRRPVPLYPLFLHPSGTLFPLIASGKGPGKSRIDKKVKNYLASKRPYRFQAPGALPPFSDIIRLLRKYRLLPAVFFLKSRADCDKALERCTENVVDDDRRKRLSLNINQLLGQYPHIAGHRQIWHLERLAVGAHHAGQLPIWKMILEKLMTRGLLDAVFATSTVAAGVNFPARTIVFLNSDRFNGKEFIPLDATQFHQMTGRAGRRGMDNIGFAVAVHGKYMDLRLCGKLIDSPPSDVFSQIKINFSMVLNLLLSHTPDQIKDLLEKSFAAYLIENSGKKKKTAVPRQLWSSRKRLWQDFMRHLTFLKDTAYVSESGGLTEDGQWASQLRVDQPMLIAEGLRLGIFPDTDPALFAAVMAAFVFEQDAEESIDTALVSDTLVGAYHKVKKGLRPFAKFMADRGFFPRPLFLKPAAAIHAWASGMPWEKVVTISGTAEGDFSMLILRTADNLRHIRTLGRAFPSAAGTSGSAIDLILKNPVLMDYEF
jgi:ATP-dependent RNA helicase HelY